MPNDQAATRNAGKSVLAADLRIVGDVQSSGTVEVMGEIDGSVAAGTLTISAEGAVKGSVKADTVDLRGTLNGKIDSGNLTLRSAAQVKADVIYSTLSIESGATVEGSFKRAKSSAAPKTEA